eukprot:Phypoly_transcript_17514.p1 GENE.Phypoly_transcript_17514~~Phypoly_transcript_17514.p1  ORF type:complete len:133 (+),score=16.77 Phypoly_transcript_17514:97-495(+)
MAHIIEAEYYPHDAEHRACDKEQRRRMLDYFGPEKEKRNRAHTVAGLLRVPFRDYHENFGYTDQIDVKYLNEIDREYSEVLAAEKEEQERRIREFQTLDVELPFSIAHIIRESPVCIRASIFSFILQHLIVV